MCLTLTERVVRRLAEAEACEVNPHARDDLQIATLTVLHAARGDAVLCSPHVLASYEVLGLHPDKVWPAVQARRLALGVNEEFSRRELPPKKPPATAEQVVRSSQLWLKKTSGARAATLRADETLLRDNTISVPMAAPSIAAGYPNSDAPSSGKRGEYSYEELIRVVEESGAPEHVRNLTLAALVIRGRWPKKQGPVSPVLTVSVRSLQDKSGVWRSTIQRRILRAKKDQYWREVRTMNSWLDCPKCGAERNSAKCPKCPHKGNGLDPREFRRTFTYAIDVEKFERTPPCRQVREIRDFRAKAKQIHVVEEAAAKPEAEPKREERRVQPKLSKTEAAKFVGEMAQAMQDSARKQTRVAPNPDCTLCSGKGTHEHRAHPGQMIECACVIRAGPKLTWRDALHLVCERWQRTEESVIESLKFWGHKLQE